MFCFCKIWLSASEQNGILKHLFLLQNKADSIVWLLCRKCVITARERSCEKVMFARVSVSHSVRRWVGGHPWYQVPSGGYLWSWVLSGAGVGG